MGKKGKQEKNEEKTTNPRQSAFASLKVLELGGGGLALGVFQS